MKKNTPLLTTDLLLLPDGRILAHNLTPALADILKTLNPADAQIAQRTRRATDLPSRFTHHVSHIAPS